VKKIKSALISVYYKDGLENLATVLQKNNVRIFSTGGTQKFLEDKGFEVVSVESLTDYPSILGGRVKTLHPKVFGGILARRENEGDLLQLESFDIPTIDLVVVDLYPFEETLLNTNNESEIIEKIDIGGISLIRAAAKNFTDTCVLSSNKQYDEFIEFLSQQNGFTSLEQRKKLAAQSFAVSSHYDTAIFSYFNEEQKLPSFRSSYTNSQVLRYGENPHQEASFHGNFNAYFDKLHGKELSYNNLVDIDAAVNVIAEFSEATFAIIKHTNTCGLASAATLSLAYDKAFACDPVSAFGGILAGNKKIDKALAEKINTLFCEVVIAPDFDADALEILCQKKNRILLKQKIFQQASTQFKSILNGVLVQDFDNTIEGPSSFTLVSERVVMSSEEKDLAFAIKAVKHLKSNGIAIVKNEQLIGMGCGQTSRVDALQQALAKAAAFQFDVKGAAMASDAFFPFPDCVEISALNGITCIAQPGGSIKDQDSIDACNKHHVSMVLTGVRHFKH
jgi:phosphoribosylaminoimidazolecarboxamide formyltransferase/IMP cyclohydrolase